jgi:hypothetical protein
MKKILDNFYNFLYLMGKARAAAHFAQIGRHDLAKDMMNLPK